MMDPTSGASVKEIPQSDLVGLCLDEGWNPLFLNATGDPLRGKCDALDREFEICALVGKRSLCLSFLEALSANGWNDWADELRRGLLPETSKQINRDVSSDRHVDPKASLLAVLLDYQCEPVVIGSSTRQSLSEQCGREMRHWRFQQRHDIVLALGENAVEAGLQHERITNNLAISRIANNRITTFKLLRAIKESPNRTRSEYETAILEAWAEDPDCSEYLDLLSRLTSFRLQKRSPQALIDSFESECIDHAVNQTLLSFLKKQDR